MKETISHVVHIRWRQKLNAQPGNVPLKVDLQRNSQSLVPPRLYHHRHHRQGHLTLSSSLLFVFRLAFTFQPVVFTGNQIASASSSFSTLLNQSESTSTCICPDRSYLNDTHTDRQKWSCEPCPSGAYCPNGGTWSDVKAMFGYIRVADLSVPSGVSFIQCLYAPACLGAPNEELSGQFILYSEMALEEIRAFDRANTTTTTTTTTTVTTNSMAKRKFKIDAESSSGGVIIDLALENFPERCNTAWGFQSDSSMCHACKGGFARSGLHECSRCSNTSVAAAIYSLSILCGSFVAVVFVKITIKEAGDPQPFSALQKVSHPCSPPPPSPHKSLISLYQRSQNTYTRIMSTISQDLH